MAAIDVREYPVPTSARKPGQENAHSYGITGRNFSIGIIYAVEPFNDDGSKAIHISISYSKFRRPMAVTNSVIMVVQRTIEQQGLKWPEKFDKSVFENGPFVGYGVHLWELTSTAF